MDNRHELPGVPGSLMAMYANARVDTSILRAWGDHAIFRIGSGYRLRSAGRVAVLSALLALSACSQSQASKETANALGDPVRLLTGVWTAVDDEESRPPSSVEEWRSVLNEEDPAFLQQIFLSDGRFVICGMGLGHPIVFESEWRVLRSDSNSIDVRTSKDGTQSPDTYHVVRPDLLYTVHPNKPDRRFYFVKVTSIAPVDWMPDYISR